MRNILSHTAAAIALLLCSCSSAPKNGESPACPECKAHLDSENASGMLKKAAANSPQGKMASAAMKGDVKAAAAATPQGQAAAAAQKAAQKAAQ
ncbi:MAG: hypothetical protein KDK99_06575 [Verrucomicrobiales bacterium]|nr:hypothetical protein [Verrucomicrobiales bacterium]